MIFMTPSPAPTTILLFAIAGVVLLAIGVVFGILLTENKHKRIAAEQAAALEAEECSALPLCKCLSDRHVDRSLQCPPGG